MSHDLPFPRDPSGVRCAIAEPREGELLPREKTHLLPPRMAPEVRRRLGFLAWARLLAAWGLLLTLIGQGADLITTIVSAASLLALLVAVPLYEVFVAYYSGTADGMEDTIKQWQGATVRQRAVIDAAVAWRTAVAPDLTLGGPLGHLLEVVDRYRGDTSEQEHAEQEARDG